MMLISAKDNPKIKQYKKLCTSRKYRAELGLFAVEGMRSVLDLLGSDGVEIDSVFVEEKALERFRGRLEVERFEKLPSGKLYYITETVAEKMTEVGQTQGAFAVVRKFDRKLCVSELDPEGKYLILNDMQDPGNLGTMLRTAAAVGVSGVILTNNSVDLYNPKVIRSAMASMPYVKVYIENDFAGVTELLRSVGIRTYAAVVRNGRDIREADFSGGCAVVIGNEGRGLTEEDTALCDEGVTIVMNGRMDSLNAAIAGTIFLWEITKQIREKNQK